MALDPNISTKTKSTKAYSPKETNFSTHLGPLQPMKHSQVQNKTKNPFFDETIFLLCDFMCEPIHGTAFPCHL
jgi:hypothetical protein